MVFYIKGRRWRLTQDKKYEKLPLKNPTGYTDSRRRVIYLNPDSTERTKMEVCMHELIHAVGRELHISLLAGPSCDEIVVWELTRAYTQHLFQGNGFYRRSKKIGGFLVCYIAHAILHKYGVPRDQINEFCKEYASLVFDVTFQLF